MKIYKPSKRTILNRKNESGRLFGLVISVTQIRPLDEDHFEAGGFEVQM